MNAIILKIENEVANLTPEKAGEMYEKICNHEYELKKVKEAIKEKMKKLMGDKDVFITKKFSNTSLGFIITKTEHTSYDLNKIDDQEQLGLLASGHLTIDPKVAKEKPNDLVRKCEIKKEIESFTYKEIK